MSDSTASPPSAFVMTNLAGVRERKRWSQQRLAEEMNAIGDGSTIDPTTISRIEKGHRVATLNEVFWFAWALGVSPLALVLPRSGQEFVAMAPGLKQQAGHLMDWYRGLDHLALGNDEATQLFFDAERPDVERTAQRRLPGVLELVYAAVYAVRVTGWPGDFDREATRRALELLIDEANDLVRRVERQRADGDRQAP